MAVPLTTVVLVLVVLMATGCRDGSDGNGSVDGVGGGGEWC